MNKTSSAREDFDSLCWNKDIVAVREMLVKGFDVNDRNELGETPLMEQIYRPDLELMKILIDAGADLNIADNAGMAPLMYAANAGISRLLLDAGAKIDSENDDGWTTLMYAAMRDDFCKRLASHFSRQSPRWRYLRF